jgi:hypothetical protein
MVSGRLLLRRLWFWYSAWHLYKLWKSRFVKISCHHLGSELCVSPYSLQAAGVFCFILFVSGLLSETNYLYAQKYNISSPNTTILFIYQSATCFGQYGYHQSVSKNKEENTHSCIGLRSQNFTYMFYIKYT